MKESFNTYFEDLLAAIEQNRDVSLRECLKTNLYISSVSESINRWYSDLRNAVIAHPPEDHVKSVIVYETDQSRIKKIEYTYTKDICKHITFVIVSDKEN